jgi:hypothetical protein
VVTPDAGADLPGFRATDADLRLKAVYGDSVHRNDGTHLAGGLDRQTDKLWQSRWTRLVQLTSSQYDVPKGLVGRRFVKLLTLELAGVRARKWNSERPLCLAAAVLAKAPGVRRASDIRRRLCTRMDFWEQGRHAALVADAEALGKGKAGGHPPADADSLARAFNGKVLGGRMRVAVRKVTDRGGGGVLLPDDTDAKSGLKVIEVLRSKHPDLRVPDLADPEHTAFEPYPHLPEPLPLDITAEHVEEVAGRLSGAAGPSGTDSVDLRNWLLRFGAESEGLRAELAAWAEWLANSHPPFAAYRAMMACRLVALDKQPGVRPVGIGEIYRRLLAKLVLAVAGDQATTACGSLNLCAGLAAGIEGAVHAVSQRWDAAAGRQADLVASAEDASAGPATQPLAMEADPPEEAPQPEALLLVEARNGFNELSRLSMLWTVRHRWAAGARFAFNSYRHAATLVLRRRGQDCVKILSQEGVTQGDPLSMVLYGVALLPLAENLLAAEPTLLQPWYADDMALLGHVDGIARAMRLLQVQGPHRGYYPEPDKSIVVCARAVRPQVSAFLAEFNFRYEDGHRYVGGFIGSADARKAWLDPQVADWAAGVRTLAGIATRFPQTAFAGLTKSLASEWQYLQRVSGGGDGEAFAPIETALREAFIPALLGETPTAAETETALRTLIGLSTKSAGMGLPDPAGSAKANSDASADSTSALVTALLAGEELDLATHSATVSAGRRRARQARMASEAGTLKTLLRAAPDPEAKSRLERNCETGAWLVCSPCTLNGSDLSADQFRDSARLRLGLTPLKLPARCDGCGAIFTVEHALSCKKGGLVLLRHNEFKTDWQDVCGSALSPSACSDEPLINTSRPAGGGAEDAPDVGAAVDPALRGDVGVRGFWKHGFSTIFDVRICDTGAPSYRGQDPKKVLARHEKMKKDKYLAPCLERRRHFTPLVFSVDGMMGKEARAASRRVSSLLAAKWNQPYSQVCGYVNTRQALALVRSTSLCLRGSREASARIRAPAWENGAGLRLYR